MSDCGFLARRGNHGDGVVAGEVTLGRVVAEVVSGGLRQFLLRGMDKVRMEWRWLCTASNLRKLVWRVRQARGYLTELAV